MKKLQPNLLFNKETNTLAWVVTNEEYNCSNFQNMQEHHYKLPIEECNCSNFQNMQEHHYKLPIVFVGI